MVKEPWQMTKEPWQMTKVEYITPRLERASRWTTPPKTSAQIKRVTEEFENDHIRAIHNALSEGKLVPAEVLKDYPDLAAQAALPKAGAEAIIPESGKLRSEMVTRWHETKTTDRIGIVGDFITDPKLREQFKGVLNVDVVVDPELLSRNGSWGEAHAWQRRDEFGRLVGLKAEITLDPKATERTFWEEVIHSDRALKGREMLTVRKEITAKKGREALAAKAIPQAEAIAKEPWQMTEKEWLEHQATYLESRAKAARPGSVEQPATLFEAQKIREGVPETLRFQLQEVRKDIIEQALKKGKLVPAEVLREYPDLTTHKGNPTTFKPGDLILKQDVGAYISELICDKLTKETKDKLGQLERENKDKEFGTPIACLDKEFNILGSPPCPRGQGLVYTVGHYRISPQEMLSYTDQDSIEILERERPFVCRTSSEDSKVVCLKPTYKGSNRETIQAEINTLVRDFHGAIESMEKKYGTYTDPSGKKHLGKQWHELKDTERSLVLDLEARRRRLLGGTKHIGDKPYTVLGKKDTYPKVNFSICEVAA